MLARTKGLDRGDATHALIVARRFLDQAERVSRHGLRTAATRDPL